MEDDEADALWFMLRGAIATSGLPGKRIAAEADVSWISLRQYASKERTPSKETYERIKAALKTHGVDVDLKERTIRVTRAPKHTPGEHKGAAKPPVKKTPKRA